MNARRALAMPEERRSFSERNNENSAGAPRAGSGNSRTGLAKGLSRAAGYRPPYRSSEAHATNMSAQNATKASTIFGSRNTQFSGL